MVCPVGLPFFTAIAANIEGQKILPHHCLHIAQSKNQDLDVRGQGWLDGGGNRECQRRSFQPELVELMKAVLEDATATLPEAKRTSAMKAEIERSSAESKGRLGTGHFLSSAEEALTLFKSGAKKYKALITDVRLKGRLSGWEVARQIRERDPAFPIIYMSGAAADQWPSQGVPNSILLKKPFAPAQIVTAVFPAS